MFLHLREKIKFIRYDRYNRYIRNNALKISPRTPPPAFRVPAQSARFLYSTVPDARRERPVKGIRQILPIVPIFLKETLGAGR